MSTVSDFSSLTWKEILKDVKINITITYYSAKREHVEAKEKGTNDRALRYSTVQRGGGKDVFLNVSAAFMLVWPAHRLG